MKREYKFLKPIILAERSTDAYLYPEKAIFLHPNGDITCGDIVFKNSSKTRCFRDYYGIILDYLKKKKIPLNVIHFRKKDLRDVVWELQSSKKNSISLKRLIEIYSYENQIAAMREAAINRLKSLGYKRWWREYKKLLDSHNYKKSEEMRDLLEENNNIANDILNFRR